MHGVIIAEVLSAEATNLAVYIVTSCLYAYTPHVHRHTLIVRGQAVHTYVTLSGKSGRDYYTTREPMDHIDTTPLIQTVTTYNN